MVGQVINVLCRYYRSKVMEYINIYIHTLSHCSCAGSSEGHGVAHDGGRAGVQDDAQHDHRGVGGQHVQRVRPAQPRLRMIRTYRHTSA